jgi:hypothetical protein
MLSLVNRICVVNRYHGRILRWKHQSRDDMIHDCVGGILCFVFGLGWIIVLILGFDISSVGRDFDGFRLDALSASGGLSFFHRIWRNDRTLLFFLAGREGDES